MEFLQWESLEYFITRDGAKHYPGQYCSIKIYENSHFWFGMPHFINNTKRERRDALRIKIFIIFERSCNNLNLTAITDEHKTGAEHIVEALRKFKNDKGATSPEPPKLYNIAGNFSSENNIWEFFSIFFVECFVTWLLFSEFEFFFLPTGPTHEDLDQVICQTFNHLRHNCAQTFVNLLKTICNSYGESIALANTKSVTNWFGLYKEEQTWSRVSTLFRHQQKIFILTKSVSFYHKYIRMSN